MTEIKYGLHFKSTEKKYANVVDPIAFLVNMKKQEKLAYESNGSRAIGKVKPTHSYIPYNPSFSGLVHHLTSVSGSGSATSSGGKNGVKKALLIGINYTGTDNALNGCINDVKNIREMLISKFNYKSENIVVITDETTLKPTRNVILSAIDTLIAGCKSGDTLYFHYSGHGTQVPDENGDENLNTDTPRMDDAICPIDFDDYNGTTGFIIDDLLRIKLVDNLPTGVKLRAIFDCCHSGTTLDLPYLFKNGEVFTKVESGFEGLQTPDVVMISGCKDSQTSADAYIGGKYSGALTWALLQNIKESSWLNLLENIRSSLQKKYSQIPQLSSTTVKLGGVDL